MNVVIEKLSKSSEKKLLDSLTREVIKGTPYYYKGYKNVIAGTKQIEEIMGAV